MISWWWWNTKLIDPSTLALDKLVKHAPRATCEHRMHNRIKPAGFHQLKLTSHIYDHLWYAIPLWSICILLFRNRSSAPRLHIWKHQWSPSTCRKTSPASLCKQWLLAVLGDELNWSHWLDFLQGNHPKWQWNATMDKFGRKVPWPKGETPCQSRALLCFMCSPKMNHVDPRNM